MRNAILLTPFFIDQPVSALARFAPPGCPVNQPRLAGTGESERVAAICMGIAQHVASAIADGDRAVSMAGDCCAAIGVAAGLERAGIDPVLVWFDAHGDFNTRETTPSGFLGGMPLAMIAGLGDLSIPGALGSRPLPADRIILTDARDLDPGERRLLQESAVHHLPSIEGVVGALPADRPIWVHLDVDVIDPREAPAMKYATPGGPSLAALSAVLGRIEQTGRLVAASLSAWDVDRDTDGRTGRAAMRAFAALIAEPALAPSVQ